MKTQTLRGATARVLNNEIFHAPVWAWIASPFIAVALSACGGGGGDTPATPTVTVTSGGGGTTVTCDTTKGFSLQVPFGVSACVQVGGQVVDAATVPLTTTVMAQQDMRTPEWAAEVKAGKMVIVASAGARTTGYPDGDAARPTAGVSFTHANGDSCFKVVYSDTWQSTDYRTTNTPVTTGACGTKILQIKESSKGWYLKRLNSSGAQVCFEHTFFQQADYRSSAWGSLSSIACNTVQGF